MYLCQFAMHMFKKRRNWMLTVNKECLLGLIMKAQLILFIFLIRKISRKLDTKNSQKNLKCKTLYICMQGHMYRNLDDESNKEYLKPDEVDERRYSE